MALGFLAPILGSVAGSAVSGLFNAREADKNRDFQLATSNTARQRDVADLKAAGLNPVLAAGYGGSSPSGSTASISAPDFAGAINSARQTSQQGRLVNAQITSLGAGAAKSLAEARSANVTADLDEEYKGSLLGLGAANTARNAIRGVPAALSRAGSRLKSGYESLKKPIHDVYRGFKK